MSSQPNRPLPQTAATKEGKAMPATTWREADLHCGDRVAVQIAPGSVLRALGVIDHLHSNGTPFFAPYQPCWRPRYLSWELVEVLERARDRRVV